ncbi:Rieske 2Fe-2S domain-containing protein [Streptomyces alboflavus]|uniref:Rieske 2Fe-2S domain-containing protein n=1 Tax=Streptomyces alboflavus TaxID=67267 RepID=UPI0037877FBC
MGELLRRYWWPVAISANLPGRDRRRVRLLGEDLVLYRLADTSVHLLEDRCPHRGTALSYGIVEDIGVRCAYHGWCRRTPERAQSRTDERAHFLTYRGLIVGSLLPACEGWRRAADRGLAPTTMDGASTLPRAVRVRGDEPVGDREGDRAQPPHGPQVPVL